MAEDLGQFFNDKDTTVFLGGPSLDVDAITERFGVRSPTGVLEDLSGVTAANAVREGQALQEQFGREALQSVADEQLRLEETLSPFVGFGAGSIPGLQGLFQPTVGESIQQSQPILDLTQFARDRIGANPALQGIDPGILDRAALSTGIGLLSRERNDLQQAVNLGQASAAQQAAGQLQTGGQRADLLSQIGNIQAAGGIGRARALGQGAQNIVDTGVTLAEAFRGRG